MPREGAMATLASRRGSEKAGGAEIVSRTLLRLSFICAFLALALISFNAFPHGPVEELYPERPSYLISIIGMVCYFFSFQWLAQLRRHAALLLWVASFFIYGLAISAYGALTHEVQGLLPFTLISFVQRKAAPMLYVLWFALLLSPLPERAAKRFFIGALLVMFVPNALHMLLEILANAGWTRVMDFLVTINPWFRLEHTSHGVWPPSFYIDRVRGLFAEPSHLAYALTPVLAFFFFRLQTRIVFVIPLLFIGFCYLYKMPNITGLLSFGFLAAAFAVHAVIRKTPRRAPVVLTTLLLAALCLGGVLLYQEKGTLAVYAKEWSTVSRIVEYCREANEKKDAQPPDLGDMRFSRFFTRMACLRLEADIARQHPLGTGFYLSGLYWKPLTVWEGQPVELFMYVDEAMQRPVPVIPQLCEYSALAAELGFPGLLLFLALCALVGRSAWQRHTRDNDGFALYMLFALLAFLLTLLSVALKSGFMLYYFLGFLYAISHNRQDEPGGAAAVLRASPGIPLNSL